jgi:hypothetical protein
LGYQGRSPWLVRFTSFRVFTFFKNAIWERQTPRLPDV